MSKTITIVRDPAEPTSDVGTILIHVRRNNHAQSASSGVRREVVPSPAPAVAGEADVFEDDFAPPRFRWGLNE